MKKKAPRRRAPISLRVSGTDAALLAEAAAIARVPRHRLIKETVLSMAKTLVETAATGR